MNTVRSRSGIDPNFGRAVARWFWEMGTPGGLVDFPALLTAMAGAGYRGWVVVESDQSVSWEQPLTQLTRPGTPVVVNIDAESLAIRVTVTPFLRGKDFLLVVQGEVRQVGGSGARGSTSLQSLLVPAGEPIAFFPLGRNPGESGRQMIVRIRVELQHE